MCQIRKLRIVRDTGFQRNIVPYFLNDWIFYSVVFNLWAASLRYPNAPFKTNISVLWFPVNLEKKSVCCIAMMRQDQTGGGCVYVSWVAWRTETSTGVSSQASQGKTRIICGQPEHNLKQKKGNQRTKAPPTLHVLISTTGCKNSCCEYWLKYLIRKLVEFRNLFITNISHDYRNLARNK